MSNGKSLGVVHLKDVRFKGTFADVGGMGVFGQMQTSTFLWKLEMLPFLVVQIVI